MFGNLLAPEIKELITARDFAVLREIFADWPPADLAELIADLPEEEQIVVFRILPRDVATETFEFLEFEAQEHLLRAMGQEEKVRLINQMSPDDRTALLEELPAAAVTQLLRLLSPEEHAVAKSLLGYPEGSIGRMMTPDFIAVRDEWTVGEVFEFIRKHGRDSETLNVIYVVDDKGHLIDDVRIREFLIKPLDCKVADIHDRSFVALKVTDDQSTAVETFKKYDRTTLPVIDSEDRLVGIVTIDDVIDVLEEETTEEIQKLGGMEALEEPYMATSSFSLIKKRATWLVVIFLGEMLTAAAMGHFEDEMHKAMVLTLFIPLILSSGGNSGAQASTLIIRALALGEVTLRDWWRIMAKEILSGISLGSILGAIGFLRIALWALLFKGIYGAHWLLIGITVGVSLVGVVLWGTLSGSMLPLLLKRLGIDPATSSGPFVASLVDVTGIVIYFTMAAFLLRGTLL